MTLGNENVEESTSLTKKSILSQVLAASAQNLMLLNLGLSVTFPSIVIPSLLGAEGNLSLTQEQASWFGSIGLIMQPIGSMLSGTTMEPFGRKMSLLIVNIPHVIAWLIMYFVQDVTWLFIGNIIIGLGIGFMEAPLMTYVGEISHTKIRGILTGYCQIFVGLGFFFSYMLGSIFSWRNTALISLSIPIITLLAIITIVPETPVWLISKGRMDDAMKSLCWVRGWSEPASVQKEFDEIVLYHKNSTACQQCAMLSPNQLECIHRKEGVSQFLQEIYESMNRKQMLRPLFLIMFIYLIQQFTGVMAIKPNLVNIYKSFGLPIDPYKATNITSGLGLVALIIIVCIIKWTGKRALTLISLLVLCICNLLLGLYAFYTIPAGFTTYTNIISVHKSDMSWIPTFLFAILHMAYYLGIGPMPWLMLSEVFPLRGRGHAVGFAAASSYIFCALITKTHFNMELAMGVHGTFWLYSASSAFGLICLYFYLPETEGKKFEQIESEFSGRKMRVVAKDIVTMNLMKVFGHRRNAVDPNATTDKPIDIEVDTLLQKKMQNVNSSTRL